MTTPENESVVPLAECPVFRTPDMAGAIAAFRSKDVVSSDVVFSGAHRSSDDAAQTCLREYIDNGLTFTNGAAHRTRRRLLNKLVRPEILDTFRDDVVVPQAEALLPRHVTGPHPDGHYRVELVRFCDRVFLHFAASLIGLVGIDGEERMEALRECVFPLSVATTSAYHKDRAAINAAAAIAKRRYIEEFYEPSRDACRARRAAVLAGELRPEDVPQSFMQMVVDGAHPDYLDEHQAIIESVILFVTSVGTSTQAIVNTVADLSTWFRSHPEDYLYRTEHAFLLDAMQESLRLHAPFTPFMVRLAARDTQIAGRPVRRGQEIHVPIPVANRDPLIWGDDAAVFDPRRPVPRDMRRYGIAFGVGEHQCLGLRVVMGSDGTGGAHVRLLRRLFDAGVAPDPENPGRSLERAADLAGEEELPRWVSYPVVLRNWQPETATAR